jgi:predicted house-cleaning NTP pyrophosphatase (Maf/HAM1 superfamily)
VGRARGISEVRADTGTITFQHYGNTVVEKYLRSGDWRNKAAAIAIQSDSSPAVASISGSFDTILGLATSPLADMLQQHGIPAESV